MVITRIECENFKNLQPLKISPQSNNLIVGDNAQGKTNFAEAIWVFSGLKSFRGTKDKDYISFGSHNTSLKLHWNDGTRDMKAAVNIVQTPKGVVKKVWLNNVPLKNISGLVGKFKCCVFSPSHLNIVEGSPLVRRRFLDIAISQVRPDYAVKVADYEKIINQRNALLKSRIGNPVPPPSLSVWDEQLAKLGTMIHLLRRDYLKKLCRNAEEIYSEIAGGREIFDLSYISSVFGEYDTTDSYNEKNVSIYIGKLTESYKSDSYTGHTGVGIHRDDLEIAVNSLPARIYGSQGQKRSAVLALKLGEARVVKEICGSSPVMLLDDVLSELDGQRREYVLNNIKGAQVFLTSCDMENVVSLKGEKILIVKKGEILPLEATD